MNRQSTGGSSALLTRRRDERVNGQPVRCYDNGGATIDRYTVVYVGVPAVLGRPDLHECVGMSAAPFHPQGFGQHSAAQIGHHLGRRVPFAELPEDCRRLVEQDTAALARRGGVEA